MDSSRASSSARRSSRVKADSERAAFSSAAACRGSARSKALHVARTMPAPPRGPLPCDPYVEDGSRSKTLFESCYSTLDARKPLDAERPFLSRDRDQPVESIGQGFARHTNLVAKDIDPLTLEDQDVRNMNERSFEAVEPGHGAFRVCHKTVIGQAKPKFPRTCAALAGREGPAGPP